VRFGSKAAADLKVWAPAVLDPARRVWFDPETGPEQGAREFDMRGMNMRSSRRRGGPPIKLIAAGVGLVVVVAALFFLASKGESNAPAQMEIRQEAKNVGDS
jgi:hypothetical protein